ncbi:bifunctional diaminohydroxyphosphoribosylaminopyrimidine deaminase/5-amino-6-(5-phosphoribosylamino)uracil reductase RibD [Entomomonas asaccharolytica]|uniref:Riboflavin biosynthesis protein RibD n=1 Tax=Entomomonas asaccharolytica TaxID=2785331 RepID=A0A974NH00_9GAMM|nr:bifunctional diaminohydroxyphosphoribosylaminopyrimidine deaminase/5-amino-6-(5-phosphoribosylamino)uracil reductase RibD [Entomomonas asaccharolytica]QQP86304.1 bifunctional diaminohydroxyphosphoribosylaminopyrimidine deaminase/5-amino-6-(5-phosphoribosylamino)uracil reductase RibD [Entomomonas asaccharolytica]
MNNHQLWMSKALQLARQGIYSTHPNPRVGCVIVADNQLVGQGWHQKTGGPHAEVFALREAAEKAKGATAYVTLEPCSYFGRTPPCADALINADIGKVVIAMQDPNPQVAGKGIAKLHAAGIEVICGVLEQEAETLNKGFIKRMRFGLPYVTVKLAMSLDGRTAMYSGESQWITGAAARSEVQRLRAQSSAIITGADTVIFDNAKLTVRAEELGLNNTLTDLALKRVPLRVLIDSKGRVSFDKAFYQYPYSLTVSSLPKPELLKDEQYWMQLPCNQQGYIDLQELLKKLAKDYAVNELLVEAGATLAGAFTQAKLVDEYQIFMASKLLGSSARPLLDLPLQSMSEAISLDIKDIIAVGDDWLIKAYPQQ